MLKNDYKVKLEVFEGPLDLLLYLIRKDEIDVYDIRIERITSQYLEYLDLMKMLDLDIAGEFMVMAATLMYIKSRTLLPEDQLTEQEIEEEGEDPRWELIRQLVEYKKFKDVALHLQQREIEMENVFRRTPPDMDLPAEPSTEISEVGLFDLINAFNEMLKRMQQKPRANQIFEEEYSVSDKMNNIVYLIQTREKIRFRELFGEIASRNEIVATFLALLELIRLKQLRAVQNNRFGEIELVRVAT